MKRIKKYIDKDTTSGDGTTTNNENDNNGNDNLSNPHTNYQSITDDDPLAPPSPSGSNHNNNNKNNITTNSNIQYRGFTTSINDMFILNEYERIDCCSLACCGILQHDRDRYLLTGITPPSPTKRLIMHIVIPITIFFMAGLSAMRIHDTLTNQVVSTGLILLLVFYFILQCSKGRSKRIEIRKDLLYSKYQIQQHNTLLSEQDDDNNNQSQQQYYQRLAMILHNERPYEDDDCINERIYYNGQTQRDIRCAHPCCLIGFYSNDKVRNNNNNNNNINTTNTDDDMMSITSISNRIEDNVCRCMYETICPGYCGMYCQLCGLCAIAQEGRDIETCILPPTYRRIDYISMEHIMKYYPQIYYYRHHYQNNNNNNNQRDNNSATLPIVDEQVDDDNNNNNTLAELNNNNNRCKTIFGHPISLLSYRLLRALIVFCLIMFIWSIIGPTYWRKIIGRRGNYKYPFHISDFILLLLTFIQSFTLLAIWYYFLYTRRKDCKHNVSLDAMIKFFASGFFLSASFSLVYEFIASLVIETFISLLLAIAGIDIMHDPESESTSSDHWTYIPDSTILNGISSSPILLNKFYDNTLSSTTTKHRDYASVFGMDHPIIYTFYIMISTFIVAGFIEELCKYFGYRMVDHPDFYTKHELVETAIVFQQNNYSSNNNNNNSNNNNNDDDDDDESGDGHQITTPPTATTIITDFSKHDQSLEDKGSAITLAMVSVAIGFACCENLMYIFFYAGSSFQLELGVLIERSFFPVHPILAAIQSIGVCKRELEGNRAMKLGHVIFPSVLFHGGFDFMIVFIAFIGKLKGQQVEDGDLEISNTTEFLSILSCFTIMISSLYYLYHESIKQRERLAAIDRQATVDRSSLL